MRTPTLLLALPLLAVTALADDARPRPVNLRDDGTFTVTIQKKEKAREALGPVLVYRYNMTGYANYQWVIIRSESQRAVAEGLAKAISPTAGVQTVEQFIAGLQGQDRAGRAERMRQELQDFEMVVHSYENPR